MSGNYAGINCGVMSSGGGKRRREERPGTHTVSVGESSTVAITARGKIAVNGRTYPTKSGDAVLVTTDGEGRVTVKVGGAVVEPEGGASAPNPVPAAAAPPRFTVSITFPVGSGGDVCVDTADKVDVTYAGVGGAVSLGTGTMAVHGDADRVSVGTGVVNMHGNIAHATGVPGGGTTQYNFQF